MIRVRKKLTILILVLSISTTSGSAFANHTGKLSPWKRQWSSVSMERFAKTVWCIEHGYRDYNKRNDRCKR